MKGRVRASHKWLLQGWIKGVDFTSNVLFHGSFKQNIVVAADVMYEPQTGAALAHRVVEALDRGSRVIIGDSPGRAGRPHFLETLRSLGVENAQFIDSIGRTCTGSRHELICGDGSTSVSETPQDLAVAIMDISR